MNLPRTIIALTAALWMPSASAKAQGVGASPLDGTWTAAFGPLRDIPATLAIEDGRATLTVRMSSSSRPKTVGAFAVEGDGSLFNVEWTGIVGPDDQPVADRKGIARKTGNVLHLALGAPGGERPESFEPSPARYPTIWTFWSQTTSQEPVAVEGQLKALQGTWSGTFGPDGAFSVELTFEGDAVRLAFIRRAGQETTIEGKVRLVEGEESKAMDWVGTDDDGNERSFPAAYEINGDSMRLHVNLRGGDRPQLDDSPATVTLARKKPDGE